MTAQETTDSRGVAASDARRRLTPWLVGFLAIVAVVYGSGPAIWNFDSYLAFPTAHSILHEGDLDLDEFRSTEIATHYGFVPVPDAGHANFYPWTVSLALVPVVAIIDGVAAVGGTRDSEWMIEHDRMSEVQLWSASLITALAATLVVLIAWERLSTDTALGEGRRRRLALLVGAAFAFGTAAWSTASRAMWQHGPALLALAVAVLMAQRVALRSSVNSTSGAFTIGAALALAYTFRPTNATAVVAIGIWLALSHRRLLIPFVAGGVAVATPWIIVNLSTWNALIQPYHTDGELSIHDEYATALAANLFSPARGLLIYSPIAVGAIIAFIPAVARARPRGLRHLDVALMASIVAVLLLVAGFGGNWWAGHSYGPRFLADTVVFQATLATSSLAALAASAATRPRQLTTTLMTATAIACLSWSVFANSQGAWSRATQCWNGEPNIDENSGRAWDWSDPQFLAGVRELAHTRSLRQAVLTTCDDPL